MSDHSGTRNLNQQNWTGAGIIFQWNIGHPSICTDEHYTIVAGTTTVHNRKDEMEFNSQYYTIKVAI